MPILTRFDSALRCTFVVWTGAITPDEWRSNVARLVSDPEFPPGPRWLVDARRANVDLIDDDTVAEIGRRMNEAADRFGGLRLAVLADRAWSKASKLLDEELTIRRLTAIQFNSLDTACVWLGIAKEQASAIIDELISEASDAPEP